MHIAQRTLGNQSLCCLDFKLCKGNMDHVYLPKAKYQHPPVIPQAPNRHLLGTTYTRHRGPEPSQHTKHVCDRGDCEVMDMYTEKYQLGSLNQYPMGIYNLVKD